MKTTILITINNKENKLLKQIVKEFNHPIKASFNYAILSVEKIASVKLPRDYDPNDLDRYGCYRRYVTEQNAFQQPIRININVVDSTAD